MTEPSLASRLTAALQAPRDASALAVFRVLFGLLVAVGAARFLVNGWVERFYLRPTFLFKYWGFEWVQPWPAWGMYLHVALLVVLGLMVAAGLFYRVSAALLFVAFTYLELLDVTDYLNHYYLLTLLSLLLVFVPLHRYGSLDAWRRPSIRSTTLPAWCSYLLRFQVAVVYFYAGMAKLQPDWLLHGQPLNIWLASRTHLPLVGSWLDEPWVAIAMSWGGFLYDSTIWLWLLLRRTRPYAYAAVLVFHTIVGVLFDIGMFPFIMTTAALVFFSSDWPRRLAARVARVSGWSNRRPPLPRPASGVVVGMASRWQRFGFAALGLYALVQLVVPLRHVADPGSVLWNEQGMRWSWKVMVREKNGAITYRVSLPDGRVHFVEPSRYLTDYQEREMSGQPDLILQLAHHIADDYRRRGYAPVEVRVDARVSLNGRRGKLMIDPTVDLTRVHDGLAKADWILAEPASSPARLAPLGG